MIVTLMVAVVALALGGAAGYNVGWSRGFDAATELAPFVRQLAPQQTQRDIERRLAAYGSEERAS